MNTVLKTKQDVKAAKMAVLVDYYNHHADTDRRIKKFRDRQTAEQRVLKLIEDNLGTIEKPKRKGKSIGDELKSKLDKKSAKASPEKGKRGRRSKYVGYAIYPLVDENPRVKPTGIGYQAMQLVLKNPGITWEEYSAGGGRTKDLEWDLERGWVEIKKV